ncbi:MAG TPA: hypothetical protein VGQ20_03155 [Acidimicrobiales bacterium]|nr:hypothetical protein [Acidimicrobiales bacterium]
MARVSIPDGAGNERARLWQLAPELDEPVHALARAVFDKTRLSQRERELVRLMVATHNNCPI